MLYKVKKNSNFKAYHKECVFTELRTWIQRYFCHSSISDGWSSKIMSFPPWIIVLWSQSWTQLNVLTFTVSYQSSYFLWLNMSLSLIYRHVFRHKRILRSIRLGFVVVCILTLYSGQKGVKNEFWVKGIFYRLYVQWATSSNRTKKNQVLKPKFSYGKFNF